MIFLLEKKILLSLPSVVISLVGAKVENVFVKEFWISHEPLIEWKMTNISYTSCVDDWMDGPAYIYNKIS